MAEERDDRTPTDWRAQFREEDRRWSARAQRDDWLVLLAMLAVASGFLMVVFWLEPGLR